MSREAAYAALVARRKAHQFPAGLLNPSGIQGGAFDSDHLGPWSRWQGNLNADLLIVGQDWGDLPYFTENRGQDSDYEQTCTNFRQLLMAAGLNLGTPRQPIPQRVFLTNAVLGIRAGAGKSGAVDPLWINDSLPFLSELIPVVRPKMLVSLGASAYKSCRMALLGRGRDAHFPLSATLGSIHAQNPIRLPGAPIWFAMYHCSSLGLRNRSMGLQLEDWREVGTCLQHVRG